MIDDHCSACRCRQNGAAATESTTKSIDRRFPTDYARRKCSNRFYVSILLLSLIAVFVETSDACFPGGRLIRRLPKQEPPLVYKQHVPNTPENSLSASGPREGRIRRFNKRYQELVVNYNPDIVFKDEEGTGEDRIMSVRCKEKLDALAMLVMNFWPGVKLRVTEAWDQDGFHASDSLHYEGRAVDVTTSDRDRNKYGLLARLASQAGFDWVYYENRMHVHASVKSDSVTQHRRTLKCFPGRATVRTSDGRRKSMSELIVGDRVAVLSTKGDRPIPVYEPVIAFLHRNESTSANFIQIQTKPNRRNFTASSEHLIYVWTGNDTAFNVSTERWLGTKAAGRLVVGDAILVSDKFDGRATKSLRFEKVIAIRSISDRGLFAPLTESGTIFVDDVLASCYAAVDDRRLAHYALAPLRFWYRMFGSAPTTSNATSTSDWQGVHWYADLLLNAAEFLERWGFAKIIDDV